MNEKINKGILGLVGLTIFIQSLGLANSYVHYVAMVLYSIVACYLTYSFLVIKGLSVMSFFAFLFTFILFVIQYMGYIGELKGNEYMLLSAIFAGLCIAIVYIGKLLNQ
jgi:hypothetical protein